MPPERVDRLNQVVEKLVNKYKDEFTIKNIAAVSAARNKWIVVKSRATLDEKLRKQIKAAAAPYEVRFVAGDFED